MSLLCDCPVSAALADIPLSDCNESLSQVQKVIFQRIYSTGTTKNKFELGGLLDPKDLASWSPLLAAVNATKVVPSPYLQAPTSEAGAAREYGGGNETLGGIPIIIGREPSTFTANVLRSKQSTIEAMKSLQCENIGVYLIDEHGSIAGLTDDQASPGEFYPIPISSFFVGDKALGGLESPDMNLVSWRFAPNWSDKFHIVRPADFNPLTDLVSA